MFKNISSLKNKNKSSCQPQLTFFYFSANILLDENFVPKVGDFGLVRIGDSSNSTLKLVTENVYGTTVYMAPEAFRGDVSVKLDSFSFGVVLLELITGLPPVDDEREDRDLVIHDFILYLLTFKCFFNLIFY